MLEKGCFLAGGLEQSQPEIGVDNFKRHAGKTGPAAHVNQRQSLEGSRPGQADGQRVEKMFDSDLVRLNDAGQVDPLIPGDEGLTVLFELA